MTRLLLAATVVAALLSSRPPLAASAPVQPPRLRVQVVPVRAPAERSGGFRALFRLVRLRAVGVISPQPGMKFKVTATAYSSTVSQTDLTPCITALGTRVRPGIVATNFLPFGTRFRLGEYVFVVEDRMNERYNGKYIIDLWYPTTVQAREFGAQDVEIEILGPEPRAAPVPVSAARPGGLFARLRALLSLRLVIPEEEECLIKPTASPSPQPAPR